MSGNAPNNFMKSTALIVNCAPPAYVELKSRSLVYIYAGLQDGLHDSGRPKEGV